MTSAPFDWGGQRDRPNRIGMFFVGIWALFLVEPLLEGWRHRGELRGWLGIACTLAFTAFYLSVFLRRRFQIRSGDSGPSQLGALT